MQWNKHSERRFRFHFRYFAFEAPDFRDENGVAKENNEGVWKGPFIRGQIALLADFHLIPFEGHCRCEQVVLAEREGNGLRLTGASCLLGISSTRITPESCILQPPIVWQRRGYCRSQPPVGVLSMSFSIVRMQGRTPCFSGAPLTAIAHRLHTGFPRFAVYMQCPAIWREYPQLCHSHFW